MIGKETAQNQGSFDYLICRFVLVLVLVPVLEAFEPLSNPSTRTSTIKIPCFGVNIGVVSYERCLWPKKRPI